MCLAELCPQHSAYCGFQSLEGKADEVEKQEAHSVKAKGKEHSGAGKEEEKYPVCRLEVSSTGGQRTPTAGLGGRGKRKSG